MPKLTAAADRLSMILPGPMSRAMRMAHHACRMEQSEGEAFARALASGSAGLLVENLRSAACRGEAMRRIAPRALALMKRCIRGHLGIDLHREQLIGAALLMERSAVEMGTGEGKTLTFLCAAFLHALKGRGVHVVTANDYLAERDHRLAETILAPLGLRCGVVVAGMDPDARRAAYGADITHVTARELGFDHLRDGRVSCLSERVQRGHHIALIDELDALLIDEARTPMILSGSAEADEGATRRAHAALATLAPDAVILDRARRTVTLKPEGEPEVEARLRGAGLMRERAILQDPESGAAFHLAMNALKARFLFERDRDYVIRDGKVVLVDPFTGRLSEGKQLSDGLHQAIEVAEGLEMSRATRPAAAISFQMLFRHYGFIAGMSGTLMHEKDELAGVYRLSTTRVPSHRPVIRKDHGDRLFATARQRDDAVISEIRAAHGQGRPVLIGTPSIARSEALARHLEKAGIDCAVLNANRHAEEAEIIARAGSPGAVTIATNMAGRGTDIPLGGAPGDDPAARDRHARVAAAGGLLVIGTARHESRRIDDQLRGRAGRQGDPGGSMFLLSLEDDLFASIDASGLAASLPVGAGTVEDPWSGIAMERAIRRLQSRIEERDRGQRVAVLGFDGVLHRQQEALRAEREAMLEEDAPFERILEMTDAVISDLVERHIPPGSWPDQWDTDGLAEVLRRDFGLDIAAGDLLDEDGVTPEAFREQVLEISDAVLRERRDLMGEGVAGAFARSILIGTMDRCWQDHLEAMVLLQSDVGLRSRAQRDPFREYETEALERFSKLLSTIRGEAVSAVFRLRPMPAIDARRLLDRATGTTADTREPAVPL